MKPQAHLRSLAALAALLLPAGSLHAASVLFVDTTTVSASWSTLITGAGHTYTLFDKTTYDVNLTAQTAKDYVNSFDVVVISGSNAAFTSLRANGANWNAISTPTIILGNYLVSGSNSSTSWRWTTPGNGTAVNLSATTDNSLDILAPTDPIWDGITLTVGTPYKSPDLFDANAGALKLGTTNTLKAGITALATKAADSGIIAVAYAEPGVLATGGGARYFIASFIGNNGEAEPFTANGEKLFLNAIDVLAVPEPGSVILLGLGGLLLAGRRRRC